MSELLEQLLANLEMMDESLIKNDVNTALRKVHESIALIKEVDLIAMTRGLS